MIRVRRLSKHYGPVAALDDVSFDVLPGEVVLLLGPNGAGKSTLLRCLLGLEPYEGEVRIDGVDPLADGVGARRRIGYQPQGTALHPDLTVAGTLRFYSALRGVPFDDARRRLAGEALAQRLDARVGDLSGGMRQRLGLAVALLGDPAVLLLDEPGSSLDGASRSRLAAYLRAAARDGRTVLISTHAPEELLAVADRTIELEDGRLVSRTPAPVAAADVADEETRDSRSAATPARQAVGALVREEVRHALRSRWVIGYAVALALLGLAAAATGVSGTAGLALQTFGRTTATLVNLCLLLAPLTALSIGAAAISRERDLGTLDRLLAQPIHRRTLLTGKFMGLLVALVAATLAGFVPAGILLAAWTGMWALARYLLFPAVASGLAAAMLAIGLLISVRSTSSAQAQGAALVLWFLFVLLYDLLLMGTLTLASMPAGLLAGLLVANPVDATRVLTVLMLEPDLYLLGPAGALLVDTLSTTGATLVLLGAIGAWTLGPLFVADWCFGLRPRARRAVGVRVRPESASSLSFHANVPAGYPSRTKEAGS